MDGRPAADGKQMADGARADRTDRVLIEAVCCSVDDCVEAAAAGVDRIELCASLWVGGLTPSLGTLIESRARVDLPLLVMMRPRAGGFCYTAAGFATLLRDVELACAHGAAGVVFGVLTADGSVDRARAADIVALARAAGKETVFHRAFDVVPDPRSALDALIDLGVTRVLTSGRLPTALEGAPLIRELMAQAADRIEILPGGGIREANAAAVVQATGARQIHLGPFTPRPDRSGRHNPTITFSGQTPPPEGEYPLTDGPALARVRAALDRPASAS